MMLRVNNEFLDFNDFVEVEKRVKLFEAIDETLGDFSYSFDLTKSAKNLKILGLPFPDVKDKSIYHINDTDLLDESGFILHKGYLRVERVAETIQCSFFSGNSNWISLLGGQLTDLDLSDLETLLTPSEIVNSADNTEGVIFPVIDAGALITRSNSSLMVEDFSGMIFVKTLFKRIFQASGIKTNGDLFNDPIFNSLLLSKVTLGPEDIDSLSSYVRVLSNQTITAAPLAITTDTIHFNDDFNFPYFDGSENPFDITLYRYTAPIKEKVKVDATIIHETTDPVGALQLTKVYEIYVNGSLVFDQILEQAPTVQTDSASYVLTLQTGDYLETRLKINNQFANFIDVIIYANSTIKITPTFIYRTKGQSLVPNWSQAKLVSNILALFCCITDYEPVSKTLTIDFFEGIKSKEPIDLSENLEVSSVDYSEFISNFGKSSTLTYQESELESVKQYNLSNVIGYGAGSIEVDNDFIENAADILESDFKAPVTYVNNSFTASLERTQFIELEENGDQDYTGVTDASGDARFAVADATIYTIGELVRVSESTNAGYDGDYLIKNVGANYIHLRGVYFNTDSTGKITKLLHRIGSDDGVYLFINTKYRVDNVAQFSKDQYYFLGLNDYPNFAYAYFNMLNTGVPINDSYKQGLSFGSVTHQLSYQRSLIDKYWGVVSRVLNDPVKILGTGHIPKLVFNRITPLRPIRIKTETTNNLYYLNRIGGYKESYLPCEVDLIKLS